MNHSDNWPSLFIGELSLEDALWLYLADLNCSANERVKGICKDCDPEHLHKYRVLLRRMLALIEITSLWVDSDHYHDLRRLLKRHLRKTNQLRDLDVFLLQHAFYLRRMKKKQRKEMHKLQWLMVRQRSDYGSRVMAWFKSDEYRREQDKLTGLVERLAAVDGSNDRVLGKMALKTLNSKVSRIQAFGNSRPISRDSRKLHRLRIVCKKLRYGMEYFMPVLQQDQAMQQLEKLKQLQDFLGQLNDLSVQSGLLQKQLQTGALGNGINSLVVSLIKVISYKKVRLISSIESALSDLDHLKILSDS